MSRYAVMWDCHGLEALAKVPEAKDLTFAILANQARPDVPNLMHWQLRARYNSQRQYEIYIFDAEQGVDREGIISWFKGNPQHAADTIRRIGHCYYSDREEQDKVVIR